MNLVVRGSQGEHELKSAANMLTSAINANLFTIKEWSKFSASEAESFMSDHVSSQGSPTAVPPGAVSGCKDTVSPWKDIYGATCDTYTDSGWCTPTGLKGRGWVDKWGDFSDFSSGGVHAGQVCCGCGGGIDTAPTRDDSPALTECLAKCAAPVGPVCIDGKTTLTNPCWANCMGTSLAFVPGPCKTTTAPPPPSTSVAAATTSKYNEWECIQSCDDADKEAVCANGIQFVNRCWAKCLQIKDFKRCNTVVLAAPGTTFEPAMVSTSRPNSRCCTEEIAQFDSTMRWASNFACGNAHQVAHPCGPGKTGQVTRICSSNGQWLDESSSLCSNSQISTLARSFTATNSTNLPVSAVEYVLAQLLTEVVKGYLSLGVRDLVAITEALEYLVKAEYTINDKVVQLTADIVGQLLVSMARSVIMHTYEQMPNLRRLPSVVADISLVFAQRNSVLAKKKDFNLMALGGRLWQRITWYDTQEDSHALVFSPSQQNGTGKMQIEPEALRLHGQRHLYVSMVYYADDSYFAVRGDGRPSTNVFAAFVRGADSLPSATQDISTTYELSSSLTASNKATCVAWRRRSRSTLERWSQNGCRVVKQLDGATRCHCKNQGFYSLGYVPHLSTKAATTSAVSEPNSVAAQGKEVFKLSLALQVCFGVSILLLCVTLSGFFIFKRLRDPKRRFLVVNFGLATLLSQSMFLVTQSVENETLCLVGAALTACFVMASFSWMAINVNIMRAASKVPTANEGVYTSAGNLRALIGWGVPMLLALIAVIVNQTSGVQGYGEAPHGSKSKCWFEGAVFWALFAGPTFVTVLITIVLLGTIVFASASQSDSRDINKGGSAGNESSRKTMALWGTALYLAMMLVCWGSVTAAIQDPGSNEGFQFVAAFTGLLLGVFIFVHQCIFCDDVRDSWLCRKEKEGSYSLQQPAARPQTFHLLQAPTQAGNLMDWDYTSEVPASASEGVGYQTVGSGCLAQPVSHAGVALPSNAADYYDSESIAGKRTSYVDIADNEDHNTNDIWDGAQPRVTPRRVGNLGTIRRVSTLEAERAPPNAEASTGAESARMHIHHFGGGQRDSYVERSPSINSQGSSPGSPARAEWALDVSDSSQQDAVAAAVAPGNDRATPTTYRQHHGPQPLERSESYLGVVAADRTPARGNINIQRGSNVQQIAHCSADATTPVVRAQIKKRIDLGIVNSTYDSGDDHGSNDADVLNASNVSDSTSARTTRRVIAPGVSRGPQFNRSESAC